MNNTVEPFGKYLLLEKLAIGGMAEVYLAKSVGAGGIGKFVAIKRILPQYSDHEEFINMFKEEAKLVMNLNHGNVVSIFDFGVERSQFFLVMEFVEGQTLRQVMNHIKKIGKSFTIDQIVYLVKEAASGLDHAHRCIDASTGRWLNIIHRDMSPQNVMLSFEGEVKVIDFGIAKAETQLESTRVGTIKGKFGYMSPEQAEGQIIDARTDVFSLGIILWELLAQDRLFTGENEQAILQKIHGCQIPQVRKLNPSVPPELEDIVLKSLMKDPHLRYASAEAFAKDLNRFLNTSFPDFSKQEFSKFMKQLYSEMYQENRYKLAEYARIETVFDGQTQIADPSEDTTASIEEGHLQLDPSESPIVDLSKLSMGDSAKGKELAGPHRRDALATKTNTTSSQREYDMSGISVSPLKKDSRRSFFISLLIFAGGLMGGFYYLQGKKNRIELTADSLPEGQPESALKMPTTVSLNIQSTPSGAKVMVDDIAIGFTPVTFHVPSEKYFKLSLIREGYISSEFPTEVASKEGYFRNVVLIPEPSTALVTITSPFPPPSHPVTIIINGKKVATARLPYSTAVASGALITVTLVDPLSKTQGEGSVVLRQKEKRSLVIQLNKPALIK